MASRIHLPIDTTEIAAAPERLKRWRAHLQRLGPRLVLWRLLWFPIWFGGELPAPWLPKETASPPTPDAPAAREVTNALDAIGRRVWWNILLAAIARGLWLPFALGSIVAIIQIIRDEDWSPERFVWVWAITVPLALLLAWFLRPDRIRVATMLDQTFALHDRMTTALESLHRPAPAAGARAPLPYLQLADAANVAIGLKGDPRFRLHLPSREISLAIMSGLFMMALLFLRGVGGGLPELSESQVPPFVPAAERRTAAAAESYADPNQRPPTVQEVEASAALSQDAQAALNALADALDDNALTQPAADAIRAGDYETAAQILRDLAGQAGSLPQESRDELASALDQAAGAMEQSSPSLSNAASQASDGLQQGGEAAQSGMQDLGDAVELAGESVVPQEELNNQMQQAQEAASNQQQGADAAQAPNQQGGQQGGASQSDPNPSNQTGGEPGQPGNSSSSSGADAQPGSADSGQEMEQSESGSESGQQGASSDESSGSQSQPGSQSAAQAGDQSQAGGETDGSGQQSGESDADSAEGGSQPGDGNPDAEPGMSSGGDDSLSNVSQAQGGGASGGNQQTPPQSQEEQQSADGAGATGEQTPSAAPTGTSVAAAPTPSGAGSAPTTVPNSSVELQDQGGGESIQLGGGGSASSLGSGAGVMVAGGEATQAPVATAGPQSNRVPDDYQTIVENYFSRDGS
ncbi:MAG: hypothetical protein IT337_17385 [Thermomicrobiales bacterium]|nr:hypothetical protein [Thermomicrobiales bacterium]